MSDKNRSVIYNKLVDWFSKNPNRYNLIHILINWGLPYKYVSNIINHKENQKILEIACGPALILDYLQPGPYIGVDLNKAHLDYAKKKYAKRTNTTFINADILTFDFEKFGKFDKILLLGFMHHLSDYDLKKILNIIPALINNNNKDSAVITFDPVYTKSHFISNKLCDLDQGRYVRFADHYRSILSEFFNLKQSNIIKSRTRASVYIVNEAIS
jgi:SAM-dependent methyltransferase